MKKIVIEKLSETHGGNSPVCQHRWGFHSVLLLPNSITWNITFLCRMRAFETLIPK